MVAKNTSSSSTSNIPGGSVPGKVQSRIPGILGDIPQQVEPVPGPGEPSAPQEPVDQTQGPAVEEPEKKENPFRAALKYRQEHPTEDDLRAANLYTAEELSDTVDLNELREKREREQDEKERLAAEKLATTPRPGRSAADQIAEEVLGSSIPVNNVNGLEPDSNIETVDGDFDVSVIPEGTNVQYTEDGRAVDTKTGVVGKTPTEVAEQVAEDLNRYSAKERKERAKENFRSKKKSSKKGKEEKEKKESNETSNEEAIPAQEYRDRDEDNDEPESDASEEAAAKKAERNEQEPAPSKPKTKKEQRAAAVEDFDKARRKALDDITKNARLSFSERIEKRAKHRAVIAECLQRGIFRTESTTIDADGSYVFHGEVKDAIDRAVEVFGIETQAQLRCLFEAVQLQLGCCVDRHNKFLNDVYNDKKGLVIPDYVFVEAINSIIANSRNKNIQHPFAYTNHMIEMGNTPCFPVPIFRRELWDALSSNPVSPLHGLKYEDKIKQGVDMWNNDIRPNMDFKNITPSQRKVIEDMAYTVSEMVDLPVADPANLGIFEDYLMFIDEVIEANEMMAETIADPLQRAASQSVCDHMKAARTRVLQDRAGGKRKYEKMRNEDGSFTNIEDCIENPDETMLRTILSTWKALATMDSMLLGAAVLEKADGTFTQMAGNYLRLSGEVEITDNEGKTHHLKNRDVFGLTPDLKRISYDTTARECVKQLSRVQAMGADAFFMFTSEGNVPNEQNINAFSQKIKPTKSTIERDKKNKANKKKKGKKGKNKNEENNSPVKQTFQDKTNKWVSKMNNFIGSMFGADWAMRGSDVKLFIENFLLLQAENAKLNQKDGGNRPIVTAKELERSMKLDPQRTIIEMMKTMEGIRAFNTMRARTVAGNTIFSEPVARFLRNHCITELALVAFVREKFVVYGMRAAEKYMPYMNSIQLLRYRHKAKKLEVEVDSLPLSELLVSKRYRDSLILDTVRFGTSIGKLLVLTAVITALGLSEPDDPDDKWKWDEWKIGGVPIRMMWYLDDIFRGTAPLAVGLCIAANRMEHGGDPADGFFAFVDGFCDMVGGLAPFQTIGVLLNFDQDYVMSQRFTDDENDKIEPENYLDIVTVNIAKMNLQLASNFVPRFGKDILRSNFNMSTDNYDHTYNYVYDSLTDPYSTKQTSFVDSEIRRAAGKDPVMALFMNVISGYYIDNPTEKKTGYNFYEQPIATISDPTGLYCVNRFGFQVDKDDVTKAKISDEEIQAHVDDVIQNVLSKFDNAEQIKSAGIVLPYEARYYTSSYLKAEQNRLWNDYGRQQAELYSGGYSPAAKLKVTELKEWTQEQVDKLKAQDHKLWDKTIPFKVPKYARWKTDWQDVYTDNATGNEITAVEFHVRNIADKLTGNDTVTHDVRPYGNFRNPLQIGVTQVQNPDKTYNAQTMVSWWSSDYSDWNKIKEFYKDAEISMGVWEGEQVLDVLTGEGRVFNAENQAGVIGFRAYTPLIQEYEEYDKPKREDENLWTGNLADTGKYNSSYNSANSVNAANGKGSYSTYPRSYKYGSGFRKSYSSASPKIYSNARTVNAPKAANMYAKNLYSPKRDYLNPALYRKGSRSAYRRQDV